MKQCFKCFEILPISEFYKHPQMPDGHVNKCKTCNKKDVSQHRALNRERIRMYDRKRATLPHRVALAGATTRRWRAKYPERYVAHTLVNLAVKSGQLLKQPCERCGIHKVHGHHEDYSKPLEVVWLCAACHKLRHRELGWV